MANRFLNNITVNDSYTLPSSDGSADQIIQTDGAGNLTFVDPSVLAVGESEQVHIACKNTSGVAISKGDPVYITGTVGASYIVEIAKADASNSAKMPAVGLVETDLGLNDEGFVIVSGVLKNLTTDPLSTGDGTPSSNDTVYVKAGGGLTRTKPTGSGNLIQNVGKVGRVQGTSAGSIAVSTIMRTNDVPNLTTGKIWVGSPTYTTESTVVHLDETNGRMGIGTTSPNEIAHVSRASSGSGLLLENSGGGGGSYVTLDFNTYNVDQANFANYGASIRVIDDGAYSGDITFRTKGAAINAAQTEKMRIDGATGNVGIGTTSPTSAKLEVSDSTTQAGILITSDGGNEQFRIRRYSNNNEQLILGFHSSDYAQIQAVEQGVAYRSLALNPNGGNVGIGTTSPGAKLHVLNTNVGVESAFATAIIENDDAQIDLTSSSAGTWGSSLNLVEGNGATNTNVWSIARTTSGGGNNLRFNFGLNNRHDNDTKVVFNSNGNVGIGTTSPAYKLDVNGSLHSSNITLADGIYHEGDTNTYINFLSDQIQMATAGSVRAYIDSSGNVGIGTTSPGVKLEVDGDAKVSSRLQVGTYASADSSIISQTGDIQLRIGSTSIEHNPFIRFQGNNGSNTTYADIKLDAVNQLLVFNDPGTSGGAIGTNPMVLNADGDLGIGTTSPSQLLHVAGASATAIITLQRTNATTGGSYGALQWTASDDHTVAAIDARSDGDNEGAHLLFHTTSAAASNDPYGINERMRITSDGNVGIGTTGPASSAKLTVMGNQTFGLPGNGSNTNGRFISIEGNADASGEGSGRIFFTEHNSTTAGMDGYGMSLGYRGGSTSIVGASGNTWTGLTQIGNGEWGMFGHDNNATGVKIMQGSRSATYTAFYSSGSETMRLIGGNVGIGTTNPSAKLDVVGSAEINGRLFVNQNGVNTRLNSVDANGPVLSFDNNTIAKGFVGSGYHLWVAPNNIADNFGIRAENQLDLGIGSSVKMTIDSSGDVGIGTTSPGQKLEVNGNIKLSETAATTDTDKFVVLDSGVLKYRTGTQVISDIGAQPAGTYNTIIGTDSDINTSGSTIIDNIYVTDGVITSMGTRALTVSDIGATPLNDIRSLGTQAFTNGSNPGITTSQVISEIESDGGFDSYTSVFKTSWSYAGNYNLTDAGRFTETAGSSWITWTDNSSDSTRGNITALAIAPNTGGSAGKVFIYNDQGSGYSPGWREVWTSTSDGSGSGLDADLLDGQHASEFAPVSHTHTWADIPNNSVNGWGGLRHTTGSGYIDFGPANTSHAHIYTDRPNFYFNKQLLVNGVVVLKGSGTTNYLSKFTGSTTLGNSLVYDNGTNVGIGTTSPGAKLSVAQPSSGDATILAGRRTGTPTIKSDSTEGGYLILDSHASAVALNHYSSNNVWLATGGGNVGIGTTAPTKKLEVAGSGIKLVNAANTHTHLLLDTATYDYKLGDISTTGGAYFQITSSTNQTYIYNSDLILSDGQQITITRSNPADPSCIYVDNTYTSFGTTYNIDSDVSSTFGSRHIGFRYNGTIVGFIGTNGTTAVTYSTSASDERLKKNIEDWQENILDKFEKIEPKEFNFISQEEGESKTKGFIAQNMAEDFPEAYPHDYSEDKYYSFNPSGMVVYLMKAVKDLVEQNKQLETRIQTLEQQKL